MNEELNELFKEAIVKVFLVVPDQYKSNLIKNMESLKIDFHGDNSINNKQLSFCHYSPTNNKITITEGFLDEVKKSNASNYREIVIHTIAHELIHMSSFYSDKDNNKYACGLCKLEMENGQLIGDELDYLVLTEGITDLLTSNDDLMVNDSLFYSHYLFERCIARQLMEIVGKDVVLDSYFNTHNIDKIKDELEKYISQDEFDNLMFFLKVFYNFKNTNRPNQKYLAAIQHILTKAFINSIKDKKKEERKDKIDRFKEALIDKDKLLCAHKYPSLFPGIDEETSYFEEELKKIDTNKKI